MTSRQDSLLAALQRKKPRSTAAPRDASPVPTAESPPADPTAAPEHPAPAATISSSRERIEAKADHKKPKAAPRRVGKPVQFWMHDQDRQLIRELSAWLAGQGIRPSDSMVVRAALRMAKTGGPLLEAYRDASQLDGRLKTP